MSKYLCAFCSYVNATKLVYNLYILLPVECSMYINEPHLLEKVGLARRCAVSLATRGICVSAN